MPGDLSFVGPWARGRVIAIGLFVATVATSPACSNESGHAGAGHVVRAAAPTVAPASRPAASVASAPLCPAAAPAPAPASLAATPALGATAAAGGAAAGRPVAVVILMASDDKSDPSGTTGPRTYKVSLTASAETATIEVDGQRVGSAMIQRVYPQQPDRRTARPAVARPVRQPFPSGSSDVPAANARAPFAAPGSSEVSFAHRPAFINPNGAPIID